MLRWKDVGRFDAIFLVVLVLGFWRKKKYKRDDGWHLQKQKHDETIFSNSCVLSILLFFTTKIRNYIKKKGCEKNLFHGFCFQSLGLCISRSILHFKTLILFFQGNVVLYWLVVQDYFCKVCRYSNSYTQRMPSIS